MNPHGPTWPQAKSMLGFLEFKLGLCLDPETFMKFRLALGLGFSDSF